MREILFKDATRQVPDCLDELTPEQYVYYIHLASWLTAGAITPDRWRVRWMSYLCGMGSADYTMLRAEYVARADAALHLVTDTFLDAVGRPTFNTCRNLLPEYHGLHGPSDWLSDVTFGRFTECTTLLEQAAGAIPGDQEEVYRGIARVLYRVPPADEVPDVLAWHAPVLFGSVWAAIQAGPVDINGRSVDFSIIFKGNGERRPDDRTGWAGITFEIAAAGVFGTVRDVEATPLWDVLMYLYKCKFEYIHDKNNSK